MSLIHFRHFRCPNQNTSIDHVAFFDFWPFLIFSTILQCCDPCYSDDRAEIDESSAYDASTSNLSSIECLHVCQIKLDHLQAHIHWHLKSINSSTKLSHCLQYLKNASNAKLLHGFVKVVTWICQVVTWIFQVVICISRPLPHQTKLMFDQYFEAASFDISFLFGNSQLGPKTVFLPNFVEIV